MKNWILCMAFCLTYLGSYSQKKQYILEPSNTIQLITKLQYSTMVYEVEESDLVQSIVKDYNGKKLEDNNDQIVTIVLAQKGKSQRSSFFISDTIPAINLSGSFETVGKYYTIIHDEKGFFKNELITESTIKDAKISEDNIVSNTYNSLLFNRETGKYYVVKNDFAEKFDLPNEEMKKGRLASAYSKADRKSMVVSRSYTLDYSIEQYQMMIDRCKELTNELEKYNKLAAKGYMSKEQYTNWKRDLVEAKLLDYRIDDFNKMYQSKSYSFEEYVTSEVLDNYNDFSKTLTTANLYAEF